MGKGSSAPPPAPDPTATIAAQSAANKDAVRESAKVNAVDIYGPTGSTTYERDANGMPIAQRTTLNPGSQYIYDQQQKIGAGMADTALGRLGGVTKTSYTTQGLPYHPGTYDTSAMPMWSASSVGRGGAGGVGGPRSNFAGGQSGPTINMGQPGEISYSGAFGTGSPSEARPQGGEYAGPMVGPPNAADTGEADYRARGGNAGQSGPVVSNAPGGQTSITVGQSGGHSNFGAGQAGPTIGEQNPAAGAVGDSTVMPYDPRSYGNMDYFRSQVGDAMYDQGMSRLRPQIEQQDRAFEQQMADRGIPVGSDAYNRAKESQKRQQNDLISTLTNQSTIGSLDATKGIVGMEQGLRGTAWNENLQGAQQAQADYLKKFGLEQDIRGRIDTDNLKERNQSINEIAMLLGGSPQMQMPNAPNMAQYNVQAPDVGGITNSAYNAQMNAYNAQQANRNSMYSGAFGIGAAAMPFIFSNSAFKHDIADA